MCGFVVADFGFLENMCVCVRIIHCQYSLIDFLLPGVYIESKFIETFEPAFFFPYKNIENYV